MANQSEMADTTRFLLSKFARVAEDDEMGEVADDKHASAFTFRRNGQLFKIAVTEYCLLCEVNRVDEHGDCIAKCIESL